MDSRIMNEHYAKMLDELFPPEHRAEMREIYERMAKEAEEYMDKNKDKAVSDTEIAYRDKTKYLFKVGDRVRVAAHFGNYYLGTIDSIDEWCIIVRPDQQSHTLGGVEVLHSYIKGGDIIQPIGTIDEFLYEFKSLMMKYGAKISFDAEGSYDGDDVNSVTMFIGVENKEISYTITDFGKSLTPDNIMDYGKE